MHRRTFLGACGAVAAIPAQNTRKPNIVLLLTDDQGDGDLSLHGNGKRKTPHMDSLGRDGLQFTQFHVNPVCSPARSSMLTDRYDYRTGVVDTFLGRSMMYPDEVTLAEMLGGAGYRTGIFGKWHLGDRYPLRTAHFRLNGVALKQPVAKGATSCTFKASTIEAGPGRLEAFIQSGGTLSGSRAAGANYVDVNRL